MRGFSIVRQAIENGWQRRGVIAWMLLPLSLLFGTLVALRRLLYHSGVLRSVRLPVPVIVIGNITAGGSGKTPLVLWLTEQLRRKGYHPGIISRGYGGSAAVPQVVCADDDAAVVGDEPLLLSRRSGVPVWIGRDRVAAGRALSAVHPQCDVLIADDGLQHCRLARDIEIVVADARGAGNGWLLPAGPLREPVSRLARVDALVVNGAEPRTFALSRAVKHSFAMRLVGARFHALHEPQRTLDAAALAGKKLHAIAGIGNPQRFFDHLTALGLAVVPHAFPDHYRYCADDLVFADCEALLMTEKDAVKCAGIAPAETWVLRVDAEITPDLAGDVVEKLNGRQAA